MPSQLDNIVKEQAGERITIRAKVEEKGLEGIIFTLTSHYASEEAFRDAMAQRGKNIISFEII